MRNAIERDWRTGSQMTVGELRENDGNNVQAMRDQGIADACNGHPAVCMFATCADAPCVYVRGQGYRFEDEGQAYREAFAYAQAYEANAEPDGYWCDCSPNCGHRKSA